ncbi:MAG: hypothetical protein CMH32_07980 [Micavibrio sp.]|nr:hypothetical protein [Micavibrio sp.]HCK33515.1 hypothetical protein [Rhodospirillaceae bacterium]
MTDPIAMFSAFAIALFVLCMKPGPDMAAVISRSLSDGFGAAAALIMGTVVAELIYLWLVSYGYFAFADHIDLIQFIFQSIGATLFAYLGIKGLLNLNSGLLKQQKEKQVEKEALPKDIQGLVHYEHKTTSVFANFMTGLTVCLGNPIIMLFYATAYPAMVDLSEYKYFVVYICSFLVFVFNGGPLFVIALIAGYMRNYLKNPQIIKTINLITSLIFIGLSITIGLSIIGPINFAVN